MIWWLQGFEIPALLTTGPALDPSTSGALGIPGTQVLVGEEDADFDSFSGGHINAGMWFGRVPHFGFDLGFFGLEQERNISLTQSASNGLPVLARPRLNAITNSQGVLLVAFPGVADGSFDVNARSRLLGAHADLMFAANEQRDLTFLFGFRYLDMDEGLALTQFTNVQSGGVVGFLGMPLTAPSSVRIQDVFDVRNRFFGVGLGVRGKMRWERVWLEMMGRLGLGTTRQSLSVIGQTELFNAGVPAGVAVGGLLAQNTNIGQQTFTEFTAIPEIELKLGFDLSQHLTCFAGYNFIYWSNVIRPGDQIDTAVNITNQPSSLAFGAGGGPARPARIFDQNSFWAQGLNFSFLFKF